MLRVSLALRSSVASTVLSALTAMLFVGASGCGAPEESPETTESALSSAEPLPTATAAGFCATGVVPSPLPSEWFEVRVRGGNFFVDRGVDRVLEDCKIVIQTAASSEPRQVNLEWVSLSGYAATFIGRGMSGFLRTQVSAGGGNASSTVSIPMAPLDGTTDDTWLSLQRFEGESALWSPCTTDPVAITFQLRVGATNNDERSAVGAVHVSRGSRLQVARRPCTPNP